MSSEISSVEMGIKHVCMNLDGLVYMGTHWREDPSIDSMELWIWDNELLMRR